MSDSSSNNRKSKWDKYKMIVAGLIALAMGIGFFVYFHGETTLVCDRTDGECTMERTTIAESESETFSLDEFHEAKSVQTSGQSRQSETGPRYKTYIVTDEGRAPLSHAETSSEPSTEELADEVNAFLDDTSQDELEITQDGGEIVQYAPLVVAVIGLLILIGGLRA